MEYFLGIDGGGSQTRAVICDAEGTVLGSGIAGPSNFKLFNPETLSKHLSTAIECALPDTQSIPVKAAFVGLAGISEAADKEALENLLKCLKPLRSATISAGNDLETALAGSLDGAPGIILVAGTGSACLGRNPLGAQRQCGGWGDLIDDLGSGGWIGWEALRACVRQGDGRDRETRLKESVLHFLEIKKVESIPTRLASGNLSRTERAKLAPIILELNEAGDSAAQSITARAVQYLAELIETTSKQLAFPQAPVAFNGGLFSNETFREQLTHATQLALPQAKVTTAKRSAVEGAAMLARRSVGI